MAIKTIGVKEASEKMGLSTRGVIYLIETEKLPAEKNESGHWVIASKAVTDLCRERAKAKKAAEREKAKAAKQAAKKAAKKKGRK